MKQVFGRYYDMCARKMKEGKFAMYLRKSREDVEAEREGEYETLVRHERRLREFASANGYRVDDKDIYRELQSGDSLAQRPQCNNLLHAVAAGSYQGVLVVNLMRLTRGDMIDQGTILSAFMYTHTLIITPEKVYDVSNGLDRDYTEMRLMFSRMEYSSIKSNLINGRSDSVSQGQFIGTYAPYGWDKAIIDRKKTLVPNADSIRVVSWYERIASGEATPRQICDELNAEKVPSPRGCLWERSMVTRAIQNPVHKGYVRWNGRRTVTTLDDDMQKVKKRVNSEAIVRKGLHDGIVDEELWQRANDALRSRMVPSVHASKVLQNPLATLLACKHCGRAMSMCYNGSHVRRYTHCLVNKSECWQIGAKMQDVIDALIQALGRIARESEAVDGKPHQVSEVALWERNVAEERKAIETLFRLVERGIITDDEFANRKMLADQRLSVATSKLDEAIEVDKRTRNSTEFAASVRRLIDELRDYDGRAQAVNDVARALIRRIEYEKDPETREISLEVFFV